MTIYLTVANMAIVAMQNTSWLLQVASLKTHKEKSHDRTWHGEGMLTDTSWVYPDPIVSASCGPKLSWMAVIQGTLQCLLPLDAKNCSGCPEPALSRANLNPFGTERRDNGNCCIDCIEDSRHLMDTEKSRTIINCQWHIKNKEGVKLI